LLWTEIAAALEKYRVDIREAPALPVARGYVTCSASGKAWSWRLQLRRVSASGAPRFAGRA
jgi:hypothetical protein